RNFFRSSPRSPTRGYSFRARSELFREDFFHRDRRSRWRPAWLPYRGYDERARGYPDVRYRRSYDVSDRNRAFPSNANWKRPGSLHEPRTPRPTDGAIRYLPR